MSLVLHRPFRAAFQLIVNIVTPQLFEIWIELSSIRWMHLRSLTYTCLLDNDLSGGYCYPTFKQGISQFH